MNDLLKLGNDRGLWEFHSLSEFFDSYGRSGFGDLDFTKRLEENEANSLLVRKVFLLEQIHGDQLVTPDQIGMDGDEEGLVHTGVQADGWFLHLNELRGSRKGFAIKTADCLPLICVGQRYIALVHAGWRGLQKGIIGKTVAHFRKSSDEIQSVYIGPAADPSLYEVGNEFLDFFPDSEAVRKVGEQFFFNAYLEAEHQFRSAGVDCEVFSSNLFTMSSERFHSYRREGTSGSRNYSIALFSE